MAGIWFPLDNTAGRVVSPEVYRANADGFNWSNDSLTVAATVFLDGSTAAATVPIFDFATGSSPGATSFNMRVWVENGILNYSAGKPGEAALTRGKSSTALPTGVPVELVITMNPDTNVEANRLLFFINGVQEPVTDLFANSSTSPYYNYQRITIGGYDDGSIIAAGLLVSDFIYSNYYTNNGTPVETSTSSTKTVWLSDFEDTVKPLLIAVQKNNKNNELYWSITDETKVIWTEGNEPPDGGGGGGDVGGIINQNQTAMQVVAKIATTAGSVVIPSRDNDQVSIQPRYPASPWHWNTATMDKIVPASMVISLSDNWRPEQAYNAVYVSGTNTGVAVNVKRTGSSGNNPAPDILEDWLTETQVNSERGRNELAKGGHQSITTIELPLTDINTAPGLIEPGMLVEVLDITGGLARTLS